MQKVFIRIIFHNYKGKKRIELFKTVTDVGFDIIDLIILLTF